MLDQRCCHNRYHRCRPECDKHRQGPLDHRILALAVTTETTAMRIVGSPKTIPMSKDAVNGSILPPRNLVHPIMRFLLDLGKCPTHPIAHNPSSLIRRLEQRLATGSRQSPQIPLGLGLLLRLSHPNPKQTQHTAHPSHLQTPAATPTPPSPKDHHAMHPWAQKPTTPKPLPPHTPTLEKSHPIHPESPHEIQPNDAHDSSESDQDQARTQHAKAKPQP